ncbi:MAG: hypothetical protein ACR2OD_04885 [Gaiellaceae bacterium]
MRNGRRLVVILLGGALLLAGTALVPGVAQAKKPAGYKLCDDGTFHVLHKKDKINGINVAKGYYTTYVYAVGGETPTCHQASTSFHNFLSRGKTFRQSWQPKSWAWTMSKGTYRAAPGKKKNQSWKKALNFTQGCDECGFEGGFIMRKVKKPS